jgi:hypothetical protein
MRFGGTKSALQLFVLSRNFPETAFGVAKRAAHFIGLRSTFDRATGRGISGCTRNNL